MGARKIVGPQAIRLSEKKMFEDVETIQGAKTKPVQAARAFLRLNQGVLRLGGRDRVGRTANACNDWGDDRRTPANEFKDIAAGIVRDPNVA